MVKKLYSFLPDWALPRAPLVAISLRTGGMWDYRFRRFAHRILNIFVNFWFLPILFFPATLLFLSVANMPLITTLTYMVLILVAPLIGLTSELLYSRLWLAMPYRTSAMIAGEVEHRTWDILRSIPYTRHQLILGKLAALWWLTETSLVYITLSRFVFFGGLIVIQAIQHGIPFVEALFSWGFWWLILSFMPLLETYAIACFGLLTSALSQSSRQASLISMIVQVLYRGLTVSIFLALLPEIQTFWVLPTLILPQWTFTPLWLEADLSKAFLVNFGFVFGLMPVLLGSLALRGTIYAISTE